MKIMLLNINPNTNVQKSETVTCFYTPLFMTLIGRYYTAFQFLKIFISEICYYIRGMLYIVSATNCGIDSI